VKANDTRARAMASPTSPDQRCRASRTPGRRRLQLQGGRLRRRPPKYSQPSHLRQRKRPRVLAWTAVRDNEYMSAQFLLDRRRLLGRAASWPSRAAPSGCSICAVSRNRSAGSARVAMDDKPDGLSLRAHFPRSHTTATLSKAGTAAPAPPSRSPGYSNCGESSSPSTPLTRREAPVRRRRGRAHVGRPLRAPAR